MVRRRISRACDLLVPHAFGARRSNDCGDGDGFERHPDATSRASRGRSRRAGTEGRVSRTDPSHAQRGQVFPNVPLSFPRAPGQATNHGRNARFAGCSASHLTDSNRRPLPTMEVLGRDARKRTITRDTVSPANRPAAGTGDTSRDDARVVSLMCPFCVRGLLSASSTQSDGAGRSSAIGRDSAREQALLPPSSMNRRAPSGFRRPRKGIGAGFTSPSWR
jgi:hypothetical protein